MTWWRSAIGALLCILLGLMVGGVLVAHSANAVRCDVNNDGKIDTNDVTCLTRRLKGATVVDSLARNLSRPYVIGDTVLFAYGDGWGLIKGVIVDTTLHSKAYQIKRADYEGALSGWIQGSKIYDRIK